MSADTYLVPVPMSLFNRILKEVPSPLVLELQTLPTMPIVSESRLTEKSVSDDRSLTMQLEINNLLDANVLRDFIRSIEIRYVSGGMPVRITLKAEVLDPSLSDATKP